MAFENIFLEDIGARLYYFFTLKSLSVTLIYAFVTLLGFLAVTLFLFIKEKGYYRLWMGILFITYLIELTYKNINGTGFMLNDLSLALNEGKSFGLDALLTYAESIEKSLLILLGLFIILFFIRRIIIKNRYFIALKYPLILSLFSLGLGYFIMFRTIGATETRPTLFKTIKTGIYYASNRLYYGKRDALALKPIRENKYKNIILIVDESIGGKYLSINGYPKETTPYLKSISDRFINLGLASSGGNCSASSNLILMSGIQLNDFPDREQKSLKKPSIFQYAKNAGYKTHYISGQGAKGEALQNYMTPYDLDSIDDYSPLYLPVNAKNIPEKNIVLRTQKVLENGEKNFIFIVKFGSHFHWENAYPKEQRIFTPTMERSDALSLAIKEKAINSYLNSIRYNVDLFFKDFLEKIAFFKRDDTLIIYTSDHGQSILEEGRIATHCDSKNPPLTQGIVPLLLFTNPEDKELNDIPFKVNHYSHYQIIPTIQKFMGYEVKAKTLLDTPDKQIFVSGDIFGRVSLQRNELKEEEE